MLAIKYTGLPQTGSFSNALEAGATPLIAVIVPSDKYNSPSVFIPTLAISASAAIAFTTLSTSLLKSPVVYMPTLLPLAFPAIAVSSPVPEISSEASMNIAAFISGIFALPMSEISTVLVPISTISRSSVEYIPLKTLLNDGSYKS